MKLTRSIGTSPGWDASPSQITTQPRSQGLSSSRQKRLKRDQSLLAGRRETLGTRLITTLLYTPGWILAMYSTIRVNFVAQEHNKRPRPELEEDQAGPLDPESNALTIRPPHSNC